MKRVPKAIYQTAAEIEARIASLETNALLLSPESAEHRAIMKEIAQLRIYAEAKRWMVAPILKSTQPAR